MVFNKYFLDKINQMELGKVDYCILFFSNDTGIEMPPYQLIFLETIEGKRYLIKIGRLGKWYPPVLLHDASIEQKSKFYVLNSAPSISKDLLVLMSFYSSKDEDINDIVKRLE